MQCDGIPLDDGLNAIDGRLRRGAIVVRSIAVLCHEVHVDPNGRPNDHRLFCCGSPFHANTSIGIVGRRWILDAERALAEIHAGAFVCIITWSPVWTCRVGGSRALVRGFVALADHTGRIIETRADDVGSGGTLSLYVAGLIAIAEQSVAARGGAGYVRSTLDAGIGKFTATATADAGNTQTGLADL